MKHFLLLAGILSLLFAAPALQKMRTYTQSDGTTFQAQSHGDEYLHFLKTKEGKILLYNPKTKNYDFATIEGDRLIPSGVPYKKSAEMKKSMTRRTVPSLTPSQLREVYKKAKKRFRQR